VRVRKVVGAAVVAGSLGTVLLLRRRGATAREHVDLYLADGSKLTLTADSPEFARLAPLAHDALRAASG
jgi:hypothetical protein